MKTTRERRKYDLQTFLVRHGISQRILAELLGICRSVVSAWILDGKVPLIYLSRICKLTKTEITAKAKWMPFNLKKFRLKWHLTKRQLAKELETSLPNIRNWENAGRIPRAYLQEIRTLNERCRCRHYRKKKKVT